MRNFVWHEYCTLLSLSRGKEGSKKKKNKTGSVKHCSDMINETYWDKLARKAVTKSVNGLNHFSRNSYTPSPLTPPHHQENCCRENRFYRDANLIRGLYIFEISQRARGFRMWKFSFFSLSFFQKPADINLTPKRRRTAPTDVVWIAWKSTSEKKKDSFIRPRPYNG